MDSKTILLLRPIVFSKCFYRIEEIANWSVNLQQIVINFFFLTKESESQLFVRVCVKKILINN